MLNIILGVTALQIFSDLFVNMVIIIAALTLGNLIVRERIPRITFRYMLLLSSLTGILGCLLMLFGVRITNEILVDFRCIPIMIMGLYFSLPAAMISAAIIGLFRILVWGATDASLLAIAAALLMGLASGLIGRTKWNILVKWLCSVLAVSFLVSIPFLLLIPDRSVLNSVLPAFNIGLLIVSFLTYLLETYIMDSNQDFASMQEASTVDFLTGLHNVQYFDNTLNAYLYEARSKHRPISLLFIDIDFFKKVNDIHGHLNGDMVLKELGKIMIRLSRKKDVVTRYGGEEFTILLPDTGLADAQEAAERIRKAVEEHMFSLDKEETIRITVSVGVAAYPETTVNEDRLIEQADIALYTAKRGGRNKVCVAGTDCC